MTSGFHRCRAVSERLRSGRMKPESTKGNDTIDVAAAVLWCAGRVWIQKRVGTNHLENYWEFPGGKIHPNENPRRALRREIKEEVGIELAPDGPELLLVQEHSYHDRDVRIYFFFCRLRATPPLKNGKWVTPDELQHFALPPANTAVLQKIERIIGSEPPTLKREAHD